MPIFHRPVIKRFSRRDSEGPPCGRGSESAISAISRWLSRDHGERAGGFFHRLVSKRSPRFREGSSDFFRDRAERGNRFSDLAITIESLEVWKGFFFAAVTLLAGDDVAARLLRQAQADLAAGTTTAPANGYQRGCRQNSQS